MEYIPIITCVASVVAMCSSLSILVVNILQLLQIKKK